MFIFNKISRNITCNSAHLYSLHSSSLHETGYICVGDFLSYAYFTKQTIYVLEIFSLMLTSRNRLYMCWYSPHVRDF